MRLAWAQYALDDRDAIFSYIESENPKAAVHVDEESREPSIASSIFRKAVDLVELRERRSW
ncbi:hypothetical protein J2Z50_004949 [Ensifer mexicanus]|nr:hypothetical protein [Sinorhizobium mexicanum]